MRFNKILPKRVEFIPDQLEEGVLYISERFRTCSHKCCCGCGEEVVTPLSPADWQLTCEGEFVSLWPSVGNWVYTCRSHYVIRRNQVKWAAAMTAKQIARVQQRDAADLAKMMTLSNAAKAGEKVSQHVTATQSPAPSTALVFPLDTKAGFRGSRPGVMKRLMRLLFGEQTAD